MGIRGVVVGEVARPRLTTLLVCGDFVSWSSPGSSDTSEGVESRDRRRLVPATGCGGTEAHRWRLWWWFKRENIDYCICQIDVEGTYETLTTDEATPIGPSIPNAFGKIFAGGPHKTFYGLKQPERWWYQWSVRVMMGDI